MSGFRTKSVPFSLLVAVLVGLPSALPSRAAGQTTVPPQEPARILTATQDPQPIRTTGGPVLGTTKDNVESWLGVPYAAPPVGPLRWQPPRPITPSTAVLKANTLPNSCAQNADLGPFAKAGGVEDCLYLNIYRRADPAPGSASRPVIVWVHGGSFWVGQGADYDPRKLVLRSGAIVVTINYRLGSFGFFAHPALDKEGHDFANYGLMDQQAALRWVQRNIAAFGGDPGNVTLAGESAGGTAIMAHLSSPRAAGLFQYAVSMSGGAAMLRHPAFGAPKPIKFAEDLGVAFAKAVGCAQNSAACLRALPAKRILDAQTPFLMNQFIIDGTVVPQAPADAFRRGQINRVPVVSGSTRDEGRLFVALPELLTGKVLSAPDYFTWIQNFYGDRLGKAVMQEYPLSRYDSPSEAYAAANGDSLFACPGLAAHRLLADKLPLYAYEFSDATAPSYLLPTTFPLLSAHTFDVPYLFPGFRGAGEVAAPFNAFQEHLSDRMIDLLSSMSKAGGREREWPRFDPKQENVMTFILPEPRVIVARFSDVHHCRFWDRTGIY
jgi:para-nitrobenzyl esterase